MKRRDKDVPKVRKSLGFGYIMLGVVFLFNFDIAVIDILPDVIGYALICLGLAQLSYMSPRLERSAELFRKMMYVGMAKMLSVVWLFALTNDLERPVGFLLFTFVFAICDFVFLVPAFSELFEGILYVSTRYDGSAAYLTRGKRSLTLTERVKKFTVAFVIIKTALTVLPETASLTINNSYGNIEETICLYDYVGLFRLFASVIVFVVGIIWLVKIERYFFKIKKDRRMFDLMREVYKTNIIPKEGIFVKISVKRSFFLAIFAFLLFIDIPSSGIKLPGEAGEINEINVLPDFLGALVLIIAVLCLRKYAKRWKYSVLASLAYGIVSAVTSYVEFDFHKTYSLAAVLRLEEAYFAFYRTCAFSIVEALFSLLAIAAFVYFIYEIIEKYTVFSGVDPANSGGARVKEIQLELKRKFIVVAALALTAVVTEIWYNFSSVSAGNYMEGFHLGEIAWMFNFLAAAALSVSVIDALGAVRTQNENKYMLD